MHHYEPTKMRSSPTLAPRYCLPAVWSLIVLLKSGMCDSYYKVLTGTVELKFTKIMASGVAPGRTARWFTPAHAVALFTMVHRPFASVCSASFGGAPVSIGGSRAIGVARPTLVAQKLEACVRFLSAEVGELRRYRQGSRHNFDRGSCDVLRCVHSLFSGEYAEFY